MTVCYEWVWERLEHGDIIQCHYSNVLVENPWPESESVLSLVYRFGNNIDGETERQYARVNNNNLPDVFDNGRKVPRHKKTEFRTHYKKNLK